MTKQTPGLEERGPIDVKRQISQIKILKHAATNELGTRWRVVGPIKGGLCFARLVNRNQRRGLTGSMALSNGFILIRKI